MERHLCGLGKTSESKEANGHSHERGVDQADLDELREVEGVQVDGAPIKGNQEADAAKHIEDDLPEGVVDGLFGLGVADKQERADRGDLPAGKEPAKVVREDDDEHRGQEQVHDREEDVATVLGTFGLMMLEIDHVTKGVNGDPAADDADDQSHDHAQRVNVKTLLDFNTLRINELEDQRACKLDNRKSSNQNVLVLDRERQDGHCQQHAEHRATDVDDFRRIPEGDPARS